MAEDVSPVVPVEAELTACLSTALVSSTPYDSFAWVCAAGRQYTLAADPKNIGPITLSATRGKRYGPGAGSVGERNGAGKEVFANLLTRRVTANAARKSRAGATAGWEAPR